MVETFSTDNIQDQSYVKMSGQDDCVEYTDMMRSTHHTIWYISAMPTLCLHGLCVHANSLIASPIPRPFSPAV